MFDHTLSAVEIEQIRRERQEADRRYNDALTVLDGMVSQPPALPEPPPLPDEAKLPGINDSWRILESQKADFGSGWRGRLAAFVWRLVGPLFQRQEHFNASLVDHLNRNIAGEREAREVLGRTLVLLRDQLAVLGAFESRLIQCLQQITAYVDTKDRDIAAAVLQDPHQQLAVIEKSIGLIQQQHIMSKRELSRIAGTARSDSVPPGPQAAPSSGATADSLAAYGTAHAYKYVFFEADFRGNEDVIRRRLEDYRQYFAGASDVLDVGCGRGEFLALLQQAGISARGVDVNRDMVEKCRALGFTVNQADAVTCLEGMADASLGGLFAAQVVEHFEAGYLVRFLNLAFEKLRPGSKIVLETINVDCWSAFFGPYLRDITHVHPLPSETLKFLLQASGFQRVRVMARSPVAEDARLRRIPPAAGSALNADVVAALNDNIDRLNGLLFTHLDYAVVGERM